MLLDYFNVCSHLGIKMEHFNLDLMGIAINTALAVALYSFTFEFVDKKNALKQQNKEQVAKLMLADVYQSCLLCLSVLEHIENGERGRFVDNLGNSIRIDKSDEVIDALIRDPFIYESSIIELFKDGTLSKEEYSAYTKNKNNFREYMFLKSRTLETNQASPDDISKEDLENNINAVIERLKS